MTNPNEEKDARPSRADVDDVADAAIGVDTRIFTTIRDTFLHTPRVLEAAYAGEREKYVPIIRLFLVLFGLQFAVMAFFDIPAGFSLDALARSSDDAALTINAWLAESGQSYEAVNTSLQNAAGLTTTLLVFLSSLPFVLLLKAYRPSRSFFGHVLAYLAPVNASFLALFLLMAIVALIGLLPGIGEETEFTLYFWAFVGSLIWYFVSAVWVLLRFYGRSALAVTLQVTGLVFMVIPMFIIMMIGQYGIAELVLQNTYDMSVIDLFRISAEHAIESENS
ncbi:hypothetical protein HXX25_07110 [Hyphobacterium sp. CCMP332]|uniref:hypothetical protein n=1 Tax=Hyphobacterium sp. CCMP332 TaxID=2749086 RepID=UPI0016504A29|nr:hypothetical protein [Hyphobacterium sp. CCMP332]QNL19094.1 hypothetical protein HXX25_07110 [Hyphobacterium sp. CCMP332]